MNKFKLFLIKIGIIPAPKGFKYNPVDADNDGKVQEGTPFERSTGNVRILEKKAPAKKAAAKKPAAKKTAKKAVAKKTAPKKKAK
jgi:hypothetical protein